MNKPVQWLGSFGSDLWGPRSYYENYIDRSDLVVRNYKSLLLCVSSTRRSWRVTGHLLLLVCIVVDTENELLGDLEITPAYGGSQPPTSRILPGNRNTVTIKALGQWNLTFNPF